MQRWWAVYAAIPGTGKIITLATFYMQRNNPQVKPFLLTYISRFHFDNMFLFLGKQVVENSHSLLNSRMDDGKL